MTKCLFSDEVTPCSHALCLKAYHDQPTDPQITRQFIMHPESDTKKSPSWVSDEMKA